MRDMIVLIETDSKACLSMARMLRSEHVYCRVLPAGTDIKNVPAQDVRGVLLAGADTGEPACIPNLEALLAAGLPLLAMGDAALTLAAHLGCSLGEKAAEPGVFPVRFEGSDDLFSDVSSGERYIPACRCITPSAACHPIAQTDHGVLGIRAAGKQVFGLAFLPEANDPDGMQLLINFCRNVCGCSLWWSRQVFMERAREEIQAACQDSDALCAISGGVDSSVTALLGNRAIGHRLHCLLIDTGLLRKGEANEVQSLFRDQLGLNVTFVDAGAEMLAALKGVIDAREKQQIIHDMLKQIFLREAQRIPHVSVVLQGTNYADVLDSPAEQAESSLRLVEPVRDLFKDEIRRVGEDLFLPDSIIRRQPFPGSGLALRILSDVTEDKLNILREADAIFRQEIEQAGLNKRLFQYYATLADDPDPTSSGYVIILRAVQVIDGDVAIASRLPHDLLERVTEAILSSLPEVCRVLYDFTPSQSYARNETR